MPRYRIDLPGAECVGELHVHTECETTVTYSTASDSQVGAWQSGVLTVPEPSLALSLVVGAVGLAAMRRGR